jgi:hypothetical protein
MGLNIEHFAFGTGMDPSRRKGNQNSCNFAYREYANRIGNWRLFEVLEELKLPRLDPVQQRGVPPLSGDHRHDQSAWR